MTVHAWPNATLNSPGSRLSREPSDRLREQFGDIDVYLFDQLLRGRIVSGMKALDAGCGSGRNLIFRSLAVGYVRGVKPGAARLRVTPSRLGGSPTLHTPNGADHVL